MESSVSLYLSGPFYSSSSGLPTYPSILHSFLSYLLTFPSTYPSPTYLSPCRPSPSFTDPIPKLRRNLNNRVQGTHDTRYRFTLITITRTVVPSPAENEGSPCDLFPVPADVSQTRRTVFPRDSPTEGGRTRSKNGQRNPSRGSCSGGWAGRTPTWSTYTRETNSFEWDKSRHHQWCTTEFTCRNLPKRSRTGTRSTLSGR